METIAVYWEDRIKTYGFSEASGLALVQWHASPEELTGLGLGLLQDTGEPDIGMLLVLGQTSGDRATAFGLLVERQWEDQTIGRLQDLLGETARESICSRSPAGLIHFHGPHFGDRYGIADAALGTLAEHDIPFLAVACSASSIYLVLPESWMAETRDALMESFLRPEG